MILFIKTTILYMFAVLNFQTYLGFKLYFSHNQKLQNKRYGLK